MKTQYFVHHKVECVLALLQVLKFPRFNAFLKGWTLLVAVSHGHGTTWRFGCLKD